MDYYSLIKRNDVLIHATIWTLKTLLWLSEGNQVQKVTSYMIPFIQNIQNRQIHRAGGRFVVARSWGTMENEKWLVLDMEFLFGVMKMFYNCVVWWLFSMCVNIIKIIDLIMQHPGPYLQLLKTRRQPILGSSWLGEGWPVPAFCCKELRTPKEENRVA